MPPSHKRSEIIITAAQAESIASLAKLYMSTRILAIAPAEHGWVAVRTEKWRWFLGDDGRVVAEGALDD